MLTCQNIKKVKKIPKSGTKKQKYFTPRVSPGKERKVVEFKQPEVEKSPQPNYKGLEKILETPERNNNDLKVVKGNKKQQKKLKIKQSDKQALMKILNQEIKYLLTS